jgi:hypothetical protein
MATFTTRLSATKPASSENVSISVLNDNFDLFDQGVGATVGASSAKPASAFPGRLWYENDTGWLLVNTASSASAAASWGRFQPDDGQRFVFPTQSASTIQAVIDSLSASAGGSVVFTPGSYTGSLQLKTGVTLRSDRKMRGIISGSPQSSVKITNNAAGWVIDTSSASAAGIVGAAIDGIDIQGGASATGGIRFLNTDASAIRNVHLFNFQDQAIYLDANSGANVIEDILTTQALMNRTRSASAGAVEVHGNDNFLHRVEASTSASALSASTQYVNAFLIAGTSNFITNCVGEFADRGYLNTGSRNRYANARADRVYGHGFEVLSTGGSNSFVGCHAIDVGQDADNTYDGFRVSSTANTFAGCFVSKAATNFPKYAFNDSVSNATILSRNDYAGCRGAASTAMFNVDGFLGSSPTIPAHPMRPANGTTSIDVTGTSFIVFAAYTGAATVTAFTNGVVGQRLYLLGDADVTIQNNSSIKTSTGANKTLAANRAYCFINYNGVWYEVGP